MPGEQLRPITALHSFGLLARAFSIVAIVALLTGLSPSAPPSSAAERSPHASFRLDQKVTTVVGGIYGVYCFGKLRCVAVGRLAEGDAWDGTQVALHWNGSRWQARPLAVPSVSNGSGGVDLWDVACPARNDCLAVGVVPGSDTEAVIDHYNGIKWTRLHGSWPVSKASNLVTISCPNQKFCLAWGNSDHNACECEPPNLVEQWSGFRWKTVAAPPGGFAKGIIPGELSCVSKRLCIAVGNNFFNGQGRAMRWDGSKWHAMKLGNPVRGTLLGSVSCAAANSCMAVGSGPAANRTIPVAEHWNGLRWTAPKPATDLCLGTRCYIVPRYDALHCRLG